MASVTHGLHAPDYYTPPQDGPPDGKVRYVAMQDFTQTDGLAVLMGTLCDLPEEEGAEALEAGLVTEDLEWTPPDVPSKFIPSHDQTTASHNRADQEQRMSIDANAGMPPVPAVIAVPEHSGTWRVEGLDYEYKTYAEANKAAAAAHKKAVDTVKSKKAAAQKAADAEAKKSKAEDKKAAAAAAKAEEKK
jgi:hypothetical protein